jgi:4-hydroxy-4-methyl-2-oxoglutarate aldolase
MDARSGASKGQGAGAPASSDVSDACDELGIEASRTGVLRPVWAGVPAVSGPLATVRLEAAKDAPSPLPELLDLLAKARGAVVLVDLAARVDCQCWGSVLATAARRFGVRGVLVNGSLRDVDDLREVGLPTFARGVYPGAMRGRLRLAAAGEPVEIDGTLIANGALAVADSSGLVAFAASEAERVLECVAARRARERAQLEAVEAGADPRAIFLAPHDPGSGAQ